MTNLEKLIEIRNRMLTEIMTEDDVEFVFELATEAAIKADKEAAQCQPSTNTNPTPSSNSC